jgi:hypothetical protein
MSEKISGPYRLEELWQIKDRTDWNRLPRDFFKSQARAVRPA